MILQSDRDDLKSELLIYSYRMHCLGVRGYAATCVRSLITDTLVATPFMASALADPSKVWTLSPKDYEDVEAIGTPHSHLGYGWNRLVVDVLKSLDNPAVVDTHADAISEAHSDAEALLILVLTCRQRRCNVTILKNIACRGPRLAAAAIACSQYCDLAGKAFLRECARSQLDRDFGLQQFWLLTSLAKSGEQGSLAGSVFVRLLAQIPEDNVGLLLECIPCIDVMTPDIILAVMARAGNEDMRYQYASALKVICERASELGDQVTIPTESLRQLVNVIR